MRWQRMGRLFCSNGEYDWMQSHAAVPVAEHISADLYRIYFNCRDRENRSFVGYVVVDLNRPQTILELSRHPVLSPGDTGLFDDSGTSLGSLVQTSEQRRLYYLGWTLAVTVPWINTIGLACAGPDSTAAPGFTRFSRGPLIGRSDIDPFCLSYPWVLQDSDRWHMWYGSNLGATPHNRSRIPHVIRHALSSDGIDWACTGRTCIEDRTAPNSSFSRPTVLYGSGEYRMWYSYRGERYRIGYAESTDGFTWIRRDVAGGLAPAGTGWESESTAYPCVFEHQNRVFLLYNGDGYGRTGFGLAVEE